MLRAHFRNEQTLLAQIRKFDVDMRQSVVDAFSNAVDRDSIADDLEMIKALQNKSLVVHHNLTKADKGYNKLRFRQSGLEYYFGRKEENLNSLISYQELDDEALESNVFGIMLDEFDSANQSESEYIPSLRTMTKPATLESNGSVFMSWMQNIANTLFCENKAPQRGVVLYLPSKSSRANTLTSERRLFEDISKPRLMLVVCVDDVKNKSILSKTMAATEIWTNITSR
jgi:hypothetical protein